MAKHEFKFCGFENGRKVFLVRCENGGEFSTEVWRKNYFKKDYCLICGGAVK